LRVGAVRIDRAVAETFWRRLRRRDWRPRWRREKLSESEQQTALQQCALQTERARYEAERAERRYREVDRKIVWWGPATLESEWESD